MEWNLNILQLVFIVYIFFSFPKRLYTARADPEMGTGGTDPI